MISNSSNHQNIIEEDIKEIIRCVGPELFSKLSDKNFLITGANGLLASYIVDTIVYLNDNYFERNRPCIIICPIRSPLKEKDRLGHLLKRDDIIFIQHDIVKPFRRDIDIDFIVHAAGKSTPKYFVDDPIGTIDTNVAALRWLLDLAVKSKIESFIYFSSAEVYGDRQLNSKLDNKIPNIKLSEISPGNTLTTGPRSCYSESKRCGEALCIAFYRKYSVPVKILRPTIIYGPGLSMYDSRVISEFIRSAIQNKSITMLNDGHAIRNYCYISDAITMFWKIFLSNTNGEIFNVGHYEDGISIKELARTILRLCTGKDANLSKLDMGQISESDLSYIDSAPINLCLDMSKVFEIFGYKANVSLEYGLKRTIDWNKIKYNINS